MMLYLLHYIFFCWVKKENIFKFKIPITNHHFHIILLPLAIKINPTNISHFTEKKSCWYRCVNTYTPTVFEEASINIRIYL